MFCESRKFLAFLFAYDVNASPEELVLDSDDDDNYSDYKESGNESEENEETNNNEEKNCGINSGVGVDGGDADDDSDYEPPEIPRKLHHYDFETMKKIVEMHNSGNKFETIHHRFKNLKNRKQLKRYLILLFITLQSFILYSEFRIWLIQVDPSSKKKKVYKL